MVTVWNIYDILLKSDICVFEEAESWQPTKQFMVLFFVIFNIIHNINTSVYGGRTFIKITPLKMDLSRSVFLERWADIILYPLLGDDVLLIQWNLITFVFLVWHRYIITLQKMKLHCMTMSNFKELVDQKYCMRM